MSGVSGVVHKAAGPKLEEFAKLLGPIRSGQSVITPVFNLPAKHIIHTVCPRYIHGTHEEEKLLTMAYKSALALKHQAPDVSTIAFVSLGTGTYREPLEVAAKIAVTELSKSEFESSIMCAGDEKTRREYQESYDSFRNHWSPC